MNLVRVIERHSSDRHAVSEQQKSFFWFLSKLHTI